MGDRLIIKQINKQYNSEKAIQNVLEYIVRDKDMQGGQEIRYWKAFGAARQNIKQVCRQFIKIQKLAGKDSKKRIRHIVIVFPPSVDDIRQALVVAEAVALYLFKDYQVIYGIHEKADQLHIHFALNPVSYKTFKKWHMSHAEFERWKENILQIVNDSLRKNEYKVLNL